MTYPWLHLVDSAWPRFASYIDARDPFACWPWLGGLSRGQGKKDNYGSFYVGGKWSVRAHIFAAVAAGDEESGNHRDHLCRCTLCVNPLHLEHVTAKVNQDRMWEYRRGLLLRRAA